nr:hypothetical protein [Tanacetum cinerariifolium]
MAHLEELACFANSILFADHFLVHFDQENKREIKMAKELLRQCKELEHNIYVKAKLIIELKKVVLQFVAMISTEAKDIAAAICGVIILWIEKPFTRSLNMYKEYLAEFWYSVKALKNSKVFSEVGVNTFRNAIGAHYLPHSSEYVAPLSIDIVRPWFETIGYGEAVPAKGIVKKSLLPPMWRDVVVEMHKEDQQATGGLTSLEVTSEASANPQLSSGNDASAVSIAEADPGNSAPNQTIYVSEGLETVLIQPITEKKVSSVAIQIKEETSSTIKLEDLAKLLSHVQPIFKDSDSPENDPVIVVDDSNEGEEYEVHATENVKTKDTSIPKSSSPSSLPTELKDLPSKFNEFTKEIKGLKKQVHKLEIELPGDLKEIPTKLEKVTKNVTSLTSQVAELKTLQWELST